MRAEPNGLTTTAPPAGARPLVVLVVSMILLSVACGPAQLSGQQAAAAVAGSGLSTEERQEYFGSCAFDSECEITTFSGCCDVCPGKVRVSSKKRLEREQEPCKEVSCPKPDGTTSCTAVGDTNSYRPVCRLRACDMVPRG
jgi:hypothetical protein